MEQEQEPISATHSACSLSAQGEGGPPLTESLGFHHGGDEGGLVHTLRERVHVLLPHCHAHLHAHQVSQPAPSRNTAAETEQGLREMHFPT